MKMIRTLTVFVLCLCIALITGTGNSIASSDEYQQEMQYDENIEAYEEVAEGEDMEGNYNDEELLEEDVPYEEGPGYDDENYMDEHEDGSI